MKQSIAIACDHAGFELKNALKKVLQAKQWDVVDLGTHDAQSVDYPDFGKALALHVQQEKSPFGIAICGTGIGISIAANRYKGVRAALCANGDMARLAREHNNANVLCLGARFMDSAKVKECVDIFLNTAFEGGRHEHRITKLDE